MKRIIRNNAIISTIKRNSRFFFLSSSSSSYGSKGIKTTKGAIRTYSTTNTKSSSGVYSIVKSYFFGEKPFPPRWSVSWAWEYIVICIVFAITGSTSMLFVRPIMGRIWPEDWKPEVVVPERSTLVESTHTTGEKVVTQSRENTKVVQLEPSMKNGPWSYRLISLIVIMPFYSALLVTIGTIFGRHHYFKRIALRLWKRPIQLYHKVASKQSKKT